MDYEPEPVYGHVYDLARNQIKNHIARLLSKLKSDFDEQRLVSQAYFTLPTILASAIFDEDIETDIVAILEEGWLTIDCGLSTVIIQRDPTNKYLEMNNLELKNFIQILLENQMSWHEAQVPADREDLSDELEWRRRFLRPDVQVYVINYEPKALENNLESSENLSERQ